MPPAQDGIALQQMASRTKSKKPQLARNDTFVPPDSFRTVYVADTAPRPGTEWIIRAKKWTLRKLGLRSRSPKLPPHPGKAFVDNSVKSAKYSLLTFLPLNLYEQFHRIANFYFLVVVVLQFIPQLSEVSGTTTVIPLVLVLVINAFKEGYDDYLRHVSDRDINSKRAMVVRAGGEEEVAWRSLLVGDVVKVTQDEDIPADMILLTSSDPDGLCYTETANLDGETNLKLKYCLKETAGITEDIQVFDILAGAREDDPELGLPDDPEGPLRWTLRCSPPTTHLYKLEGALVPSQYGVLETPVTAANLLLRGTTLKKTDWVLGVVVYTGAETRIVLNQAPAPRKVTQLERHMNKLVIGMFTLQVLLGMLGALGDSIWMATHPRKDHWYLTPRKGWPEVANPVGRFFVWWLKWVLLLNQLIPISLYVTLELVKVMQCRLLFNRDRRMYCAASNTPFNARTTTLNEELGQVQYVLSDKTGTLTQNVMGFVWASIGGLLYGPPPSTATPGIATCGQDYVLPPDIDASTPHSLVLNPAINHALGRRRGGPEGAAADAQVEDFVMALAVCNTVTPTVSHGQLMYQAESPDEEALVTGASFLGYRLASRSTSNVQVDVVPGVAGAKQVLRSYQVLAVLEFNSDRKRMSVIVQEEGKGGRRGGIRLLCKGADNIILERLRKDQTLGGARTDLVPATLQHLDHMARSGYRTLCFAYRDLSDAEYQEWAAQFQAATVALDDRDAKVAAASALIETELVLMGATAVEDKLQDGVPESIEALARMGIKTWVLTGDKVETAICIAESCRLFPPDMHVLQIREADLQSQSVLTVLEQREREADAKGAQGHKGAAAINGGPQVPTKLGIVVEGAALGKILRKGMVCEQALLDLCGRCNAVVFCRVSPLQKAQVTNLVKDRGAVTLGIGDGANDVSMIQAAHIGVGISGREGRAAVLASDFSFAQFKFLVRLLLWHGRQSYKRNSEVVLYAFYKNVAYVLPMLYYGFVSGFSVQPTYPEIFISTFNAIWTAFPIIVFAILEQDVDEPLVLTHPQLYHETRSEGRRAFFRRTAVYMSIGVWHSIVAFLYPLMAMTIPNSTGNQAGLSELGTAVFTAVVIITNLALALRSRYWTAMYGCFVAGSMLLLVPFLIITSRMKPTVGGTIVSQMSGVGIPLLQSPRYWLAAVIGAPALALLLDIGVLALQRLLRPKLFQHLQRLPAGALPHCATDASIDHILPSTHIHSDQPVPVRPRGYTRSSSLLSQPMTEYYSAETQPAPRHPSLRSPSASTVADIHPSACLPRSDSMRSIVSPRSHASPSPTDASFAGSDARSLVARALPRVGSLPPLLSRSSTKQQRELRVHRSASTAGPSAARSLQMAAIDQHRQNTQTRHAPP